MCRYAPPPPQPRRSFAQALSDAGYAAGFDMYMWQQQGGAYGGAGSGRRSSLGDPYAVRFGSVGVVGLLGRGEV